MAGPSPEIAENLSPAERDLILNDTRAAIVGLFLTGFAGKWVSHPEASRRAENKLVQLEAAAQVGLRVPRTIVTQDPDVASAFCEDLDYAVVVKPVAGTTLAPLLAGRATPELLAQRSRIEQSPVILQELVPGRRHLRVCCFGTRCHAVLLETDHLDWRHPLDAEMRATDIDDDLARALSSVVAALGLRMGIFDLKLVDGGAPAFLEVNPQGQFLFLDGLCGTDLMGELATFLLDEAC